jgi:protein-tyrosine phosphatase
MSNLRRLPFEGVINFRDLGGYAAGARHTRWQTVYRADSLANLTPADLERLNALDLHGICDYRLGDEAARSPDRLPEQHSMVLLNPGYLPKGTEDMLGRMTRRELSGDDLTREVTGHYQHFGALHVPEYKPLFEMILEADGRGVLVHCTSGKDRTGWGAALVMLAAGCADMDIIADYTLTNAYRRDLQFMFPGGADPAMLHVLTSAQAVYIETALAAMREVYGTGAGWMEALGLEAPERKALQDLLTEAAA